MLKDVPSLVSTWSNCGRYNPVRSTLPVLLCSAGDTDMGRRRNIPPMLKISPSYPARGAAGDLALKQNLA